MSLNLGSTSIDSLYLGSTKIGEAYLGSTKVYASVDPYNPLGLPPNTIRVKLNTYSSDPTDQGDSRVCVDAENKIWDITKNSNDWGTNTDGGETYLGQGSWLTHNLMIDEVLGANTSNVTNMEGLFGGYAFFLSRIALFDTRNVTNMVSFCNGVPITSIPKFDTRNVTDIRCMLQNCYQLTSLPDFDLSSVTNMSKAFINTAGVESGALALYQQASALPNIQGHANAFKDCGKDTQTGAAELAQIPPTWGGTMGYNPLNLPAKTIRAKFSSGYTPSMGSSQTLVDAGENVWDITNNSTNWESLFETNSNLLEVIGANTTGVTGLKYTFLECNNLTSVSLFDMSSVVNAVQTFYGTSLTSVPLFNTGSVVDMRGFLMNNHNLTSLPLFDTSSVEKISMAFSECYAVQSGALALYQQASANPRITEYSDCFYWCGKDTQTGAAELAQIPSSWGGTGA